MVHLFNKTPDYEAIEFAKPLKGGDGKYFISSTVSIEGETKDIMCQFGPDLVCKSELNNDATSIDVQIKNEKIVEFVKDCEEHLVGLAKDNKDSWFPNQNITDNYLEQAFMPSVKTIKKHNILKLRTSKKVDVFNSSKELIQLSDIEVETKVSVIVQVAGLWFTKTRFGVTWMVKQIKLNEDKSDKVGESLFNEEEEEEEIIGNVFPDE
jgi:hypothetical protein